MMETDIHPFKMKYVGALLSGAVEVCVTCLWHWAAQWHGDTFPPAWRWHSNFFQPGWLMAGVFSVDRSSSWTAQLQQQVGCRESCQQPVHGGDHAGVRGGAAHSLHPGAETRPQCCGWVFPSWHHSKPALLVTSEWHGQLLSPVRGGSMLW